ncbi:serine/threonine-protein kinase [Kitasatospora sp. NA04385]|uniref:serine/threonine-protein kinase n=1 Tax=Kitasatospora sp. NA04385 TaxID=2742135 RepID=UPI0020CB42F2|nr:serine/threonine-protein kinase [Kitasatospora sp. NA04385]
MHGARLDGRYRLESVLGSGGMGKVWRAFDERVGRPVAVKLLTNADAASASVERFAAEARAAGNLSSPHIVTIHDFGRTGPEDGRAPFLVMEFLDGRSLDEVVSRGGLPPVPDALEWTRQVCTGLASAHRAGLVHRDIKPANVMLLPDGTVKILDFGIAKHLYEDLALTGTGHAVGTAAYMAPEQARGDRSIGPAADLYAVGCLLHTLLVGRPPFTGAPLAVLHQHLTRQPEAPGRHRAAIPAAVDRLVLHLLEKEPADRPADTAEVIEAITILLETGLRSRRSEPPRAAPRSLHVAETETAVRAEPAGPFPPTVLDAPPADAPPADAPPADPPAVPRVGRVPARRGPEPAEGEPAEVEPSEGEPEFETEGAPEGGGEAPAKKPSMASGRSALVGAVLICVQLVALAAWSVLWAVPVSLLAFFGLVFLIEVDGAGTEGDESMAGCFVALGAGTFSALLLLFASPLSWWAALPLGCATGPALWGAQRPLVRWLGRALIRRRADVQGAVGVGLVNGAVATGLLTGTRAPALLTVLLGLFVWVAASGALTLLLPLHRPAGDGDDRPARAGKHR